MIEVPLRDIIAFGCVSVFVIATMVTATILIAKDAYKRGYRDATSYWSEAEID